MAERGLTALLAQAGPIPLDARITCAPGEVLALVGPSGSGKSTILRAIAGLHRPREGRIVVNGAVWFDATAGRFVPPHRRRVGLVFQNYALFPHMTALGNVMAALGHAPSAERAARARRMLDMLHLGGLEGRKPVELSGGQQQRVAMARALARDPEVLLLDEPFSAVDRTTRHGLYEELAGIRVQLAAPVVFVTHDFDEAARMAHRLCLLDRGRVLQTGAPSEVLARPLGPRAARLLDIRNVFTAQVVAHAADHTLIDWNGRRLIGRRRPEFPAGATVAWSVPGAGVIIRRTDLAPDTAPNRLDGRIRDLAHLSQSLAATVVLDGADAPVLTMTLPAHYARRTNLNPGSAVVVALTPDAIHLMAPDGEA